MQSFYFKRVPRLVSVGLGCLMALASLTPVVNAQKGGEFPPHGPRQLKPLSKEEQAELRDHVKTLSGAERKGWETLRRMMKAEQQKAFIAREVRLSASGEESEFWIRCDPRRGIRFEGVRPSGQIVLDDQQKTYIFQPKERRWYMRDSAQARMRNLTDDLMRRLLKGSLRVSLEGQDTVAGRPTDIVRVEPTGEADGQRPTPSRRFWVDKATGVRVKHEVIRPDGRISSSSYYLNVDFAPRFRAEDFAAPADATPMNDRGDKQKFVSLSEAQQAGCSIRTPSYLPKGFSLRVVELERRQNQDAERAIVTVRYGNGLSVISFTRLPGRFPVPYAERLTGPNRSGFLPPPSGMEGRAYTWQDGPFRYFLLGSLPEAELLRIAQSLK